MKRLSTPLACAFGRASRIALAAALASSPSWANGEPPAPPTPNSTSQRALFTELYHIEHLRFERVETEAEPKIVLVPGCRLRSYDDNDSSGIGSDADHSFIEILEEVYQHELEEEGRSLAFDGYGRLMVRAPEAVHRGIRRLIVFAEEAVNAQVEVAVDWIRLPPDSTAAPLPARSTAKQAGEWLAQLPAGTQRTHHEMFLRAGSHGRFEETLDVPLVLGHELEIADTSACYEPVSLIATTGTRLRLQASAAPGGVRLALAGSWSSEIESGRRGTTGFAPKVGEEPGSIVWSRADDAFQDLQVASQGLASHVFLKEGGALAFETRSTIEGSEGRRVVLIRHIGGTLPTRLSLPLANGEGTLELVDRRAVVRPSFWQRGMMFRSGGAPSPLWARLDNGGYAGEPILEVELDLGGDAEVLEQLTQNLEAINQHGLGEWLFLMPEQWNSTDEDEVTRRQDSIERFFDGFGVLVGEPAEDAVSLQVRLERAGELIATADVPATMGYWSSVSLGRERLDFARGEAEVAQRSAGVVPRSGLAFDGLLLSLRPCRGAGGAVELELAGGASLAGERQPFELGNPGAGGFLHQARAQSLLLDERVQLRADEGEEGAWTRVLGGDGGLCLTIRVGH